MPRTFTVERTVYTFAELSEAAKDTARQRHSIFLWDDGIMQEDCQMIAENLAEAHGLEDLRDLTFSLYTPGGEPEFSGTMRTMVEGSEYVCRIKRGEIVDTVPTDESELSIGHEIDSDSPEYLAYEQRMDQAMREVAERMDALSSAMLRAFYALDDDVVSDEAMIEAGEANGYEYDEHGHLA